MSALARLAWPVVLARLGIMVMGLTDAVVVGRHSGMQLAWHALAWAPTAVVLSTGVGLCWGAQAMTARRVGEGRRDLVGGVLRRGLAYSLAVGLVCGLVLAAIGPWFLRAVGLAPDLAAGAAPPLIVFSLSLPLALVATVCSFVLEGLGEPTPGMVAIWLANIVNLAANLWLVPGHSGLPVEGAAAAAWATSISRIALAGGLLIWIASRPDARALGLFSRRPDLPGAASEQIRIGLGAGASAFIELAAFSGLTIIMGRVGGFEAAAWAVVLNVASIVFMVPLGLSTATGVLVGRAFGAGDPRAVRAAGATGLVVTAAMMLAITLVVCPLAGAIAGAYTTDAHVVGLATGVLVLSGLFFLPDGLQVVAAQSLRARGDVWLPTVCHFMSYAVVMLPLGWFLGEHLRLGVAGGVWAVIIASLVSATLLIARFWFGGRKAK